MIRNNPLSVCGSFSWPPALRVFLLTGGKKVLTIPHSPPSLSLHFSFLLTAVKVWKTARVIQKIPDTVSHQEHGQAGAHLSDKHGGIRDMDTQ